MTHRYTKFFAPDKVDDPTLRRSIERYRRIVLTALTSLASKGITLITAIAVVPLTFRYLGPERYGLWMTMTSLVLFLGFADMGIGNGLTAKIAEAQGSDDVRRMSSLVSCAFFFLLPMSMFVLFTFLCISPYVNWARAYGLHNVISIREAGSATTILVACCLFSMPFGTVLRVQTAFQQGFLADGWNAVGNIFALGGIICVIHYGGNLPYLVASVAGLPLLVLIINWLVQFFHIRPGLRPRLSLFETSTAQRLFAIGGLFFVQQIFGLIYYLSDNLIIARTMGASEVAHYAVMQRIFSIGLIAQYLVAPLWPAILESIARGDFEWASQTAKRALVITGFISTIAAIFILALSRYLVHRWSGFDPGRIDLLRVGFTVWVVLVGYIATMNSLLNQGPIMKVHVAIFGMASLVSLILKIFFANHGCLPGVIWATNIGFGIFYVVPTFALVQLSVSPQRMEATQCA